VPVTLLGGYLGAGKTTVLNEILARTDRPIAVLVNEIGSVNIDAGLIKSRSADTVELTDGCVCCDITNGLGEAFDSLRARDIAPDHVIIELSGAAQPQRVEMWANSPGFRLDGVIVLVDCDSFTENLEGKAGHLLKAQIDAADLLALTKIDLVTKETVDEVHAVLAQLAPDVPIVMANDVSGLAPLIAIGGRRPNGIGDVPQQALFDIHTVRSVEIKQPITEAELNSLLDGLSNSTVRAKGVFEQPDGSKLLVQVVGRRRMITPLPQAEVQATTPLVVIET
jgi:G3E family GTPase